MARCPILDHSTGEECLDSLYKDNDDLQHPIIQQYENTFSDSYGGYDQHLLVITQNLSRLPDECLVFLRRYGVLDEGDSHFLLNDSKNPSTQQKLMELVNILTKKPRHAYWYLAHSMKSKAFPIFQHLHGDITCCVCKQIQRDVENQARLKEVPTDTKSETMERNMENSRKENDTLRNRLIEKETAIQNLEKYCTSLEIESKKKIADENTTNTKLSRYQEKLKKMEIENIQLKQNYEYARTEWENVKTHYDDAVIKNFSLMKKVEQLNEELRNVQKLEGGEENKEKDQNDPCNGPWGKPLKIVRRGPTEQCQTGQQASSQLPIIQSPGSSRAELSRVVHITKAPSQEIGIEVSGGNVAGIYVTTLVGYSPAELAGVRLGDKIVKINTFDMSRATKDGAIAALNYVKGDKSITMEIHYTTGCKEILDQRPHDSMYIRTCRKHAVSVPKELSFEAGEKLHVTKTFTRYDSKSGQWKWRATRVTAEGKQEDGYIPVQPSLIGLPEELHNMLAKKLGTTDSGQEVVFYERLPSATECRPPRT